MSECTEPQAHLIGSKTATAGAVGKQIHLLLFNAVFHVPARAIKIFVKLLGAIRLTGEVGDNKTRVAPFLQQLGLAYNPSLASPALKGPVFKVLVPATGAEVLRAD